MQSTFCNRQSTIYVLVLQFYNSAFYNLQSTIYNTTIYNPQSNNLMPFLHEFGAKTKPLIARRKARAEATLTAPTVCCTLLSEDD